MIRYNYIECQDPCQNRLCDDYPTLAAAVAKGLIAILLRSDELSSSAYTSLVSAEEDDR